MIWRHYFIAVECPRHVRQVTAARQLTGQRQRTAETVAVTRYAHAAAHGLSPMSRHAVLLSPD